MRTERDKLMINIEAIAEAIHHVYCRYMLKVHGTEYWTKGDYSLLNEETKEADRYIARFIRDDLIQNNTQILPDRYKTNENRT